MKGISRLPKNTEAFTSNQSNPGSTLISAEILPVKKQALYWKGADHPVKRVEHPGSKANPFMERIKKAAQPEVSDLFSHAIEKALNALADETK